MSIYVGDIEISDTSKCVKLTGDQTISGTKTFSGEVKGESIAGAGFPDLFSPIIDMPWPESGQLVLFNGTQTAAPWDGWLYASADPVFGQGDSPRLRFRIVIPGETLEEETTCYQDSRIAYSSTSTSRIYIILPVAKGTMVRNLSLSITPAVLRFFKCKGQA